MGNKKYTLQRRDDIQGSYLDDIPPDGRMIYTLRVIFHSRTGRLREAPSPRELSSVRETEGVLRYVWIRALLPPLRGPPPSRREAPKKKKTPRQKARRAWSGRRSAVAAATENDDDSENNDPGAVVIKETAEAVVHTFA